LGETPSTRLPRLFFTAFAIDAGKNFIIAGYYNNKFQDVDPSAAVHYLEDPTCPSFSCSADFVLKLDSAGNFVWAKTMRSLSGSGGPELNDVAVDKAGNVYGTGYYYDSLDFDPGPGIVRLNTGGSFYSNAYIFKWNNAGNYVWANQLTGALQEQPKAIETSQSAHLIVAGAFAGAVDFDPGPGVASLATGGDNDMFVLELDTAGNFSWVKQFPNPGDQAITDIDLDVSDNIYATGSAKDTVDFDPGPGTFTINSIGGSDEDAFVFKLDNTGAFVWARRFGPINDFFPPRIDADEHNNTYSAGQLFTSIDVDPGSGTFASVASGTYIQKLDASGNFTWARSVPNADFRTLCTDLYDNVYLGGTFNDTVDFDPDLSVANVFGQHDAYLLKLGAYPQGFTNVQQVEENGSFFVYPNPATDQITISTGNAIAQNILLTDIFGREIMTVRPQAHNFILNIASLDPGIYLLQVNDSGTRHTIRLVKN
jgi:hypothetical protein